MISTMSAKESKALIKDIRETIKLAKYGDAIHKCQVTTNSNMSSLRFHFADVTFISATTQKRPKESYGLPVTRRRLPVRGQVRGGQISAQIHRVHRRTGHRRPAGAGKLRANCGAAPDL